MKERVVAVKFEKVSGQQTTKPKTKEKISNEIKKDTIRMKNIQHGGHCRLKDPILYAKTLSENCSKHFYSIDDCYYVAHLQEILYYTCAEEMYCNNNNRITSCSREVSTTRNDGT